MKRKTKSYLITHIAYGANLKKPSKLTATPLRDKLGALLLITAFAYFLLGIQ